MVAPLYNSAEIPVKKPEQAHSGLWFDRFFNLYNTAWDLEDTAKAEWIKSMAGTVGQLEQLESFIKRMHDCDFMCELAAVEISPDELRHHFFTTNDALSTRSCAYTCFSISATACY